MFENLFDIHQHREGLSELSMRLKSRLKLRGFVWEIALKIPTQKTHLGNLTCDIPDDFSIIKSSIPS